MDALDREGQLDLLGYREAMIANDQIRQDVRTRVANREPRLEDLRLLSVGPMSQGDELVNQLITSPKPTKSPSREPRQTSGAQQFAAVLARKGGPNADFWIQKLRKAE